MGFIKNALIGIALYEGLKYITKRSRLKVSSRRTNLVLGGKLFRGHHIDLSSDQGHRHHLDRPELTQHTHLEH
ncbi:MAG: hypothetical protein V4594_04765 [Bacteroidota bacterium]